MMKFIFISLLSLFFFFPKYSQAETLVIEKVIMHETPQSGTWLFCFKVKEENNEAAFHIPNREYEGDGIVIAMNLELANVSESSNIIWWMGLDDDESDVCGADAEDQAEDNFPASRQGVRTFNPRKNWSFTMHWHLK